MNFFEHQVQARKKTRLLVFLFCCGVISIILSLYLVFKSVQVYFYSQPYLKNSYSQGLDYGEPIPTSLSSFITSADTWFDLHMLSAVTAVTLLIVGLGSAYRFITLGDGGRGVAEMMGGSLVAPDTKNAKERVLINVVEEMAIASGMPVPQVYIMQNETAINAFAAGTNPNNCVIGVTRGALESLSRDELQGVIAHEFSHIFNGDMKLNMNLIGAISGIVIIATIGRVLLRSTRLATSSRDKKGNPLPLIGLALVIIGYLGVFFARLIKAAVSRQREYLADASAVQYTRNPLGIAGALDKISGSVSRKIETPFAEETSHMLFESPFRSFGGVFATHPPIEERIKRVAPNFHRGQVAADTPNKQFNKSTPTTDSIISSFSPTLSKTEKFSAKDRSIDIVPAQINNRFGTFSLDNLSLASKLLQSLPQELIEKAHDPIGAQAVVFAMTFTPTQMEVAREVITKALDKSIAAETRSVYDSVRTIDKEKRLAVIELALPTIRGFEIEYFKRFYIALQKLVELEEGDVVFEFCLLRLVEKAFEKPLLTNKYRYTLRDLHEEVLFILKIVSRVGADSEYAAQQSFKAGLECMSRHSKKPFKPLEVKEAFSKQIDFKTLSHVLKNLNRLEPSEKSALLQGCSMAIATDGRITIEENDLLRTISITLGVPLPL